MTNPRITEHHLPVTRTARYYTRGAAGPALREVWFACHGYGQLGAYFLRRFDPLDDGTRLIVAPEALSRFYLGDPGASHAKARVGATWMTREDRLHEIQDYVNYLDAVHHQVLADIAEGVRVVALGFSQGVATACRWAALGRARVDQLVLWAERVPPDLDLAAGAPRLRAMGIRLVGGTADPAVPPEALEQEKARLEEHGIPCAVATFAGGHELDAATLLRIAGTPPRSGPPAR